MKNFIKPTRYFLGNTFSISIIKGSHYKILILVMFFLLVNTGHLFSQNCNLELNANSNIESVNDQGREYFLKIKNNGIIEQQVKISFSEIISGTNPDGSNSIDNVSLNANLVFDDNTELNRNVIIDPMETFSFKLIATVPPGTSIEKWNCIQVKIESDNCTENQPSLLLFTFIPDTEKE